MFVHQGRPAAMRHLPPLSSFHKILYSGRSFDCLGGPARDRELWQLSARHSSDGTCKIGRLSEIADFRLAVPVAGAIVAKSLSETTPTSGLTPALSNRACALASVHDGLHMGVGIHDKAYRGAFVGKLGRGLASENQRDCVQQNRGRPGELAVSVPHRAVARSALLSHLGFRSHLPAYSVGMRAAAIAGRSPCGIIEVMVRGYGAYKLTTAPPPPSRSRSRPSAAKKNGPLRNQMDPAGPQCSPVFRDHPFI